LFASEEFSPSSETELQHAAERSDSSQEKIHRRADSVIRESLAEEFPGWKAGQEGRKNRGRKGYRLKAVQDKADVEKNEEGLRTFQLARSVRGRPLKQSTATFTQLMATDVDVGLS